MGTVYLARTAGGVLVAVKMVRADLAHDDEFRRRFRSEVDRARQVPPFCTAEVLDVKPNGTLVLQARKRIKTDDEEQVFVLSGTCRAEDITADNTILKTALTAVAKAELDLANTLVKAPSRGVVTDYDYDAANRVTSASRASISVCTRWYGRYRKNGRSRFSSMK